MKTVKLIFLTPVLILIWMACPAQILESEVTVSAGGTATNVNVSTDWTIGQWIAGTIGNSTQIRRIHFRQDVLCLQFFNLIIEKV